MLVIVFATVVAAALAVPADPLVDGYPIYNPISSTSIGEVSPCQKTEF